MKKNIVVVVILIGLVAWGIYDTMKKKDERQASLANSEQAIEGMDMSSLTVGINQGNIAPDFELNTPDGEKLKLSDFRGQKVIVNMWATWCPPCRVEMPDMQKFYEKYKDEKATIIAVNMTSSEKSLDSIPNFLKEYGITFPVVLDEQNKVGEIYQVYALPTSIIIDSQGIIQQKVSGPMNYEMMEKFVSEIR
ncbi:MAG TPA: TlpA family protein disulfide reductase [Paenibacillus sp.]|uniref:peroxiredoxin family protein n=1 Tax=Paenibacillus TaxID=44249 RepID=UPI000B9FF1A7|nr:MULTISPECIES: TlpA disulfide reductase family protein [Paenibacillus]OZQ69758.1 cytochrome C biogenesis protein [Paenibacillus taichungensis]HBU82570.1 TlpA family protein disulfide reductase [Paenibacillus sp.]